MATQRVARAGRPVSQPDKLARRLRWVLLAIPAAALLGGIAILARDPRLGLLATAVILGWTQLAGL